MLQQDAVALVELDVGAVSGALPATAVRVRLERGGAASRDAASDVERVAQIGKAIGPSADAIEAGLYRCTPAIFGAMAAREATGKYFTLADAMDALAAAGSLGAAFTAGLVWFAIETLDQLETT